MIELKNSLLENFYEIEHFSEIEKNKFTVRISLNKEHKIFEGHFPGHPVTPGVCMMQIIKEVTEGYLNVSLQLQTAENIKFMAIINPEENSKIGMDFDIKEEDNNISLKSVTYFEETVALKFSGIYNKKL
ncbi:3-hydroxyacyl-ACP dehydratase [Apibacter raozihei]|nr:3-hydroxyacyl-ACP dehydratase [Apibacter raozihei]